MMHGPLNVKIYHDARSSECQKGLCSSFSFVSRNIYMLMKAKSLMAMKYVNGPQCKRINHVTCHCRPANALELTLFT